MFTARYSSEVLSSIPDTYIPEYRTQLVHLVCGEWCSYGDTVKALRRRRIDVSVSGGSGGVRPGRKEGENENSKTQGGGGGPGLQRRPRRGLKGESW